MSKKPRTDPEAQPTDKSAGRDGTAVWYFIGATFLFAGPTLLREQVGPELSFVAMIAGLIVLVAGLVVVRTEWSAKK